LSCASEYQRQLREQAMISGRIELIGRQCSEPAGQIVGARGGRRALQIRPRCGVEIDRFQSPRTRRGGAKTRQRKAVRAGCGQQGLGPQGCIGQAGIDDERQAARAPLVKGAHRASGQAQAFKAAHAPRGVDQHGAALQRISQCCGAQRRRLGAATAVQRLPARRFGQRGEGRRGIALD
jgi:hypothetical protein